MGPAGPLASLGHRLQLPSECSLAEVLSGWWWPAAAAGFISQTSGTWSRPSCGDSPAKHTGSTGLLFSDLSPRVCSRPASRLCLPSLKRNLMWEAWLGGFGPLAWPLCPPGCACGFRSSGLPLGGCGAQAARRDGSRACVKFHRLDAASLSPAHSFREKTLAVPKVEVSPAPSSPPPCGDPDPRGAMLCGHGACAGPGVGDAAPAFDAPGLHRVSPSRRSRGGRRPAHFQFLSTLNI